MGEYNKGRSEQVSKDSSELFVTAGRSDNGRNAVVDPSCSKSERVAFGSIFICCALAAWCLQRGERDYNVHLRTSAVDMSGLCHLLVNCQHGRLARVALANLLDSQSTENYRGKH